MKSKEIRRKFFDFFTKRNHQQVPSSSLIPAQDPTLLFANAGMNQFKDIFLGKEKRSYDKAVSIQKCVRAGGKHSDLDNVGFTKRHLTFFEMMGNFSFGNYFKEDAIKYAWEFLTEVLGLPEETLHITVYKDDDQAYEIWQNIIGVPKERIHRLGKEDNYWQMGDTGPCGPCTEIYVDRGSKYGSGKLGSDEAQERYLEVWNLVFMQNNQQTDGSAIPLKKTGVDTGMGLERLSVILQNKDSVFETDLFAPLIQKIEALTNIDYEQQPPEIKAAFHVLADHIRSASHIIADGGAPSNEGRGYVLRKIIRRAALFAQKLTDKNIFPQLAKEYIAQMGQYYPELKENEQLICKILTSEIEKFAQNLVRGQNILNEYIEKQKDKKVITGKQAFKLYDTFGFPLELIQIIAQEKGYTVDLKGFEQQMQKQQEQSGKKVSDPLANITFKKPVTSEFTGYDQLQTPSEVIALVENNKPVSSVKKGSECYVITKKSPFFIVGGGQVPDSGWLLFGDQQVPLLEVRYIADGIAARIKAPVDIAIGDKVTSVVNKQLRINAMKNHTATHLLQAALIELLGKQIKQSGSLVHPDYLRFDFTYHSNLTPEQIKQVENLVNEKIRKNIPVRIEYTTFKNATERGVLAFFGDKYNPEKVRIVEIPEFSAELCGGTHVERTGDIGTFKITEVTALSAGHRRIVALTGPRAIDLFQDLFNAQKKLSHEFKVKKDEVVPTVLAQKQELKHTQSQLRQLKKQLIKLSLPTWEKEITPINAIPFLFIHVPGAGHDELKDIIDHLVAKKAGFYFVISSVNDRSIFLTSVSPEFTDRVNLKNFASWLKDQYALRGGGKKNILQGGGGKFDTKLKDAIMLWVKNNS